MSSKPLYNVPGVPQLTVQRANHHEPCFFVDKDYQYYLDILHDCANEYNCHIHAYVLMPNHIHLLSTTYADNGISQMMQALSQAYASYINKTYGCTASLWDGTYKSCVLESDLYLLNGMCYIEQNPVRAKLVNRVDEYRWSSFHSNSLGQVNNLIKPHPDYTSMDSHNVLLENSVIRELSEAMNDGKVLGSSSFKKKIAELRVRENKRGECWDCVMFY